MTISLSDGPPRLKPGTPEFEKAYYPWRIRQRIVKEVTDLVDEKILAGDLTSADAAQMMEALETRYRRWSDGIVPEEIIDDLIDRWHEGEGQDVSLHEWLRISWRRFKQWAESFNGANQGDVVSEQVPSEDGGETTEQSTEGES